MRLISAILCAGNMSFTPSKDVDSCELDKAKAALACAALLGIVFDGLASALTSRLILVGDEIVHKPLTIEESGKACEALIKAVYGAAFDFVVEKVNQSIVGDRNENGRQVASIGVLGIFGFETLKAIALNKSVSTTHQLPTSISSSISIDLFGQRTVADVELSPPSL